MTAEYAKQVASRLTAALDHDPSLRQGAYCTFGMWDGGRRGENTYTLESIQADGDAVVFWLVGGRAIVIHEPVGAEVWKRAITIRQAAKFAIRYGPSVEREIVPPVDWPRIRPRSHLSSGGEARRSKLETILGGSW